MADSKNNITIFENEEFGQVRTTIIGGEPWFVAADVCKALELADGHKSVALLDEDEKGWHSMPTLGGEQKVSVINEPGLYSLVLRSRKPEAKAFKRWITHEVLPSIRQNGIYATDDVIDQILDNPDFGIALLQKLKDERAARVEAERKNAILMHVNKTYTATEIAKELGMKSAQALNAKLAEMKIQFKQNNTWVLYSNYANLGYTEIKQQVLDSGRVVYDRRFTQDGRKFILELLDTQKEEAL